MTVNIPVPWIWHGFCCCHVSKNGWMAGTGEAASANLDAEASSESGVSRSWSQGLLATKQGAQSHQLHQESSNYPSLRIQICPKKGISPIILFWAWICLRSCFYGFYHGIHHHQTTHHLGEYLEGTPSKHRKKQIQGDTCQGSLTLLGDHPRTCKWLGSPLFTSHKFRPFGRGPITPCLGDEIDHHGY